VTLEHAQATRYLTDLRQALSGLAPAERDEVVDEIRNHIADATAAGRAIEEVLAAIGPVDRLARAYKVELLTSPRDAGAATLAGRTDRWLKLVGLVALGSLPSFIVVIVLGTVGVTFVATGVAVFMAGIADSFNALPSWMHMDVEPWVAIVIGPLLVAGGGASLWGLVAYVRFLVRLVRRALPSDRG